MFLVTLVALPEPINLTVSCRDLVVLFGIFIELVLEPRLTDLVCRILGWLFLLSIVGLDRFIELPCLEIFGIDCFETD